MNGLGDTIFLKCKSSKLAMGLWNFPHYRKAGLACNKGHGTLWPGLVTKESALLSRRWAPATVVFGHWAYNPPSCLNLHQKWQALVLLVMSPLEKQTLWASNELSSSSFQEGSNSFSQVSRNRQPSFIPSKNSAALSVLWNTDCEKIHLPTLTNCFVFKHPFYRLSQAEPAIMLPAEC